MMTFWMVAITIVLFGLAWVVIRNAQADDKRRKQR
jgi:hypothetical protein